MTRIKLQRGFLRSDIQQAFSEFFGDPVMTKKSEDGTVSHYMCNVKCLLGIKSRYIVCTLFNDRAHVVGAKVRLSELDWETIQTRELDGKNSAGMETHEYIATLDGVLLDQIKKVQCSDLSCTYECAKLPLVVEILHTDANKSYNMDGTIINALETFQTVVSWAS